jgi:hypothetical protein
VSIYHFGKTSLVDEVTVHHTEGGGVRAYLHARDGATPDAIDVLKKSLTAHALQWTPIQEDGKPLLEVRGFGKQESNLLRLLDRSGAIAGPHTTQATPDDKISFKNKLRKNTLSLSGLSYFIGDMSYLSYAIRESHDSKTPQSLLGGIFYALGTPFLVFFGRGDKSDLQLKHMSYNLIKDMEKQGIEVPKDAAVRDVANGHNATLWKKIRSFCERYPAEIANSVFAGAGSMIMWEKIRDARKWNWHPVRDFKDGGWKKIAAFLKHKEFSETEIPHARWSVLMDVGLGTLTVIAGLVSVLIEEEAPKKDEQKKTGLAGIMQKIRHRPLAVASATLLAATMAHAGSTYVDLKNAKALKLETPTPQQMAKIERLEGSLVRRGIFVASNIVAEIIMGISSKGHGAGVKSDKSLEHSAYAVAADLIQRTAPDRREAMLEKVSAFYANKKHLSGDPAVITQGIRKELEHIGANPWMGIAPVPTPADKTEAKDANYWRDRAAAPQPAPAVAPAF